MADLMVRRDGPARSFLTDVFGFDPLRAAYPGAGVGLDVRRDENGYTVEIPVPGYKPDQIDVTVEDRVLTVSGKSERRNFTRTLVLPDEIDHETIDATVEHGLLTLALRFHPKAQPKKIAVKIGS